MDNNLSESDHQLSPELAEKKAKVERLGYTVRNIYADKWVVWPPEGVRFLKIRAPKKPAYFRLDHNSLNSDEAMREFWDNLPEERRYYEDNPTGGKRFYRVDPDAKDEWDRFRKAEANFFDVLFDTPESLQEYEEDEAREEFEDFREYCTEVIYDWMIVAVFWHNDGIGENYDDVFAVRWDGDFPHMTLKGVQVMTKGWVDLAEFRTRDFQPAVYELHEYDATKLQLRLMARNHPDLILSSSNELCGDTEVRWVLPELIEHQGMTLTYASPKRGKTALVMTELWCACQKGLCNVIYLAFEGHNGLGARNAALKERFGSCPTFAIKKADWNLSDRARWEDVREFVAEMKRSLAVLQDAPTVVVFDTVGAALGTGSRISGAPETFLGEVKRLQRETGVALWLVSHQNDRGELYGFKGFTFDADVVTRIIRKSNGSDHVHSRLLGRHVKSRKLLSTFRLVEVGPAFVAEQVEEGVAVDAPKANEIPGLQDSYRPLVSLLDDAGAADGLTEDELRDVLNGYYRKPGVKTDTVRQRRNRAKSALLKAGVLDNRDGVYYLVA